MSDLSQLDLDRVVRALPEGVRDTLTSVGKGIVAGGFIRAVLAGEEPNDLDIFGNFDKDQATAFADDCDHAGGYYYTPTTLSVEVNGRKTQIVYGHRYGSALEVLAAFDFTVCQAAVWYDIKEFGWRSACATTFYSDLAARRLIYTAPRRPKETHVRGAANSAARLVKYSLKGYSADTHELGKILVDVAQGLDGTDVVEQIIGDKITRITKNTSTKY